MAPNIQENIHINIDIRTSIRTQNNQLTENVNMQKLNKTHFICDSPLFCQINRIQVIQNDRKINDITTLFIAYK